MWTMFEMYVCVCSGEIQRHFDGFGLEPQFAQHTRMGALSGGQKVTYPCEFLVKHIAHVCMYVRSQVKVVLGAGLWNLPHIVILDEPTNFLDRDSLGQATAPCHLGCNSSYNTHTYIHTFSGALATAIKDFKGGIFMISHNAEFYEALCPEKWILESGRVRTEVDSLIHTFII